jgi:hypothetical protein
MVRRLRSPEPRRRHRARTALRVLGTRARRARLAPAARLRRRHARPVAQCPVAARQLREEPPPAPRCLRRPPGRVVLRRRGGRPGRPGDHVAAAPAADAQHDGARLRAEHRRHAGRPRAPLHAPRVLRPAAGRGREPPLRGAGLPPRARDVGRRGADPPVPDEGARRAALDLPAVLRALHADGPGGQLDASRPQAEVRAQAGRPAGPDARVPAGHPRRPRRRRLRWRRGEPAVQEPRGVRRRSAGDRVGARHPARDQGPHGHAPALAAGRPPVPGGCRWPCTRTSTPPSR